MPDYNFIRNVERSTLQQNAPQTPYNVAPTVNLADIYSQGRFPKFYLGLDNEDIYGKNQGTLEKWANAAGKFAATTASTFLTGTAGLINGLYQWIDDGKFSSFYDNAFNNALQNETNQLENTLPTYYTKAERDAPWYSPKTWGTANFWSDTIFKNAGFAVGAIAAGSVWTKALTSLVSATAKGITAGGAAEMAAAAEEAALTGNNFVNLNTNLTRAASQFSSRSGLLNFGENATRAGIASFGEASIEALNANQQYKNRLIADYQNKNGFAPEGQDLQSIEELADTVGNVTFGANVALLSATNYIQFPKLAGMFWKSGRAEAIAARRGIGEIIQEGDNVLNRTFAQAPVSRTSRILSKIKGYSSLLFSGSEAFEEGAQYAIPISIEDYVEKGKKGQERDFIDSLGEGIKRTFQDKEGIISILSGGITGGIMERIGGIRRGEGLFPAIRQQRRLNENTRSFVDALNQTQSSSYIQEGVQSLRRAEAYNNEANNALSNNDRVAYEEAKNNSTLSYLLPRIQYGRFDLVQDDINGYRQLAQSQEGWNELIKNGIAGKNIEKQDFLENLNQLQNIAENINTQYEALETRYGNDTRYSPKILNYLSYNGAKIDHYNQEINRLLPSVTTIGIGIQYYMEAAANKTLTSENISELNSNIESLSNLSPEQIDNLKSNVADLLELAARRAFKIQEYRTIRDNPTLYQETPRNIVNPDEVGDEPIAPITVNNEELSTTIPYTFGDGTEGIVIGENEDGTLQVQDTNGNVSNKSRNDIITNPNEKSDFFNLNKGAIFNVGNRLSGQLRYDPQTDQLFVGNYEITSNDLQSGLVTSDNIQGNINFQDSRNEAKIQDNLKVLQDLLAERVDRQSEIQERINQRQQELKNIQDELNVQQWTAEELVAKKKGWLPNFVNSISALTELRDEEQAELDSLQQENTEIQSQINELQDLINNPPTDLIGLTDEIREQQNQLENLVLNNGSLINQLSKIIDDARKLINRLTGIIRDKLFNFNQRNPNPIIDVTIRAIDQESPEINQLLRQIQQIENFEIAPASRREQQTIGQIQDLVKQINDYDNQIRAKQNILDSIERNLYPIINPAPQSATENVEVQEETVQDEPIQPTPTRGKSRIPGESDKKPINIGFQSTVLPREDGKTPSWYSPMENFTKNFRFLPNERRQNINVVYVTDNNASDLGLDGIIELTSGTYFEDNNISRTDIDEGRILTVVVETDPETNTNYFIDALGNRLTEVGKKADINQVVIAPLANTKETWTSNDEKRFAGRTGFNFQEEAAKWRQRREEIFNSPSTQLVPFVISRGRPSENITKKNNLVGSLISQDQIGQPGIISIVGSQVLLSPSGDRLNVKPTDVVVQNGGATELVFSNDLDSSNTFNLLTALAIRPDQRVLDYLSGIMYFKEGQNWVDINNSQITINGKTYPLTQESLQENKEEIIGYLKELKHNINRSLLQNTNNFSEFTADESGNLTESQYQNYQAYLLSPNNPNGEKRTTPLFTYVTGFQDQYLILQDQAYGQEKKQEDTIPEAPIEVAPIIPETEQDIVNHIKSVFENLAATAGQAAANKMQEYANRIKAGESQDKIFEGLAPSFINGINSLLEAESTSTDTRTLVNSKQENLDIETPQAYIYNNNMSNAEDAVAIGDNIYAVSDGLGGGSLSGNTARFSKLVSKIATEIKLSDYNNFEEYYKEFSSRLQNEVSKQEWVKSAIAGKTINQAAATLSVVEDLGLGKYKILSLGDSTIYKRNKLTGEVTPLTEFEVSEKMSTKAVTMNKDKIDSYVSGVLNPVFNEITINPNEELVITSDYFSTTNPALAINEVINKTHTPGSNGVKDDISLIRIKNEDTIISPEGLPEISICR